jgi:hypothetical protein
LPIPFTPVGGCCGHRCLVSTRIPPLSSYGFPVPSPRRGAESRALLASHPCPKAT